MPTYSYKHQDDNTTCTQGSVFDFNQSPKDWPLSVCPWCGSPVERLLGRAIIKSKPFNAELRDKGFTKLVRVDDGIFENVTRRNGEDKYVDRRRPETLPILEKTIKD